MAVKIKLMPDYGCNPLWWFGDGRAGNIDPVTLPLSQKTIRHLDEWADSYSAGLNWDDPYNSPDLTQEESDAFEAEGINLWKQLRSELSPHYEVLYFSDRLSQLLTHPSELEVFA